jgi:hypothetical protein
MLLKRRFFQVVTYNEVVLTVYYDQYEVTIRILELTEIYFDGVGGM